MSTALTENYRQLFLADVPMIDTRSPGEFAKGHFPHTLNLPLMSDSERAQVGTCYKQHGQQAAITLGHQLVHGAIKAERVNRWAEFLQAHPEGRLFCWRGGLRSQICQEWLAERGVECTRVAGGYKSMRRYLLDFSSTLCSQAPFVILAGHTGSAKTELLKSISPSVDLEALANHRGSAFGKRLGGQPAQTTFENQVYIALLKARHKQPQKPIVLEDESHLIGRCALPIELESAMKIAPIVVIDSTLTDRIEHSFQNYILNNLAESEMRFGKDTGFQQFAADLRQSLNNIQRRLGGVRYQQLSQLLEDALTAHLRGDNSLHVHWIASLLGDYYDPMYQFQITKKQDRIFFRGSASEVVDFLKHCPLPASARQPYQNV